MPAKTSQLQIRVSPVEKAALRARAEAAGMDVSRYVLARALPASAAKFADLVDALAGHEPMGPTLAALEDLLVPLGPNELAAAVQDAARLSDAPLIAQNLAAAMVEQAADRCGVAPPAWTLDVPSLEHPWFATDLRSLRPYLIASSPVPFRRRNLFVEMGLGARV